MTTASTPAIAEQAIVTGKVTGLAIYGVFVRIDADNRGLLHVSQMAGNTFAEREARLGTFKYGDTVEAMVIKVTEPEAGSRKERRVSLSEKALSGRRSQEIVDRAKGATMTLSVIRPVRDGLLLKLADGRQAILPDANLKSTPKASIMKSRRTQVRLVGVDHTGRVVAEKA